MFAKRNGMDQLLEISNRLIRSCDITLKRKAFHDINWAHRLIEIKGARGVGKTTLMLQKAVELQRLGQIGC